MQCILLPGKALGPFRLGYTLRECISELQFNSRDFKQINTTFNINDETQDDIVLDIKTCGIYLRFDSIQQRLKLIDVYNLSKISIYYHKQLLSSPEQESKMHCNDNNNDNNSNNNSNDNGGDNENKNTFARIYNIMGLTHPGYYDKLRNLYYVEYDGLWLSFILNYDPGPSSLPVDLNDGSSPLLNRLIVFYGKNGFLSHQLPPLGQQLSMIQSNKLKPTCIDIYAYYFEPIYVTLNEGIKLGWRNRNILFGSSVQDVLSDIGPPYTIHYKRLSRSKTSNNTTNCIEYQNRNYFFNYIDLGLDILFNGYTHKVSKFILHTNCVGHPDFNRWCKSNFNIILFNDMNCVITSNSKWKDILKYMGSNTGSPIMYRSSHGKIQNINKNKTNKNKNKNKNKDNQNSHHQSIKIYGYQSVLFEIMGNQSISTVTLFHENNYNKMQPLIDKTLIDQQNNKYKLPEVEQINSFNTYSHHHSKINPTPLSKSIEEAANQQILPTYQQKIKNKNKNKNKIRNKEKKKRRIHSIHSKNETNSSTTQDTVVEVEIDTPIVANNNNNVQEIEFKQQINQNDNNQEINENNDMPGYDNIKL